MSENPALIKIKNRQQLIENAESESIAEGREIALRSLEIGISAVHPKNIVGRVAVSGNLARIIDAWGNKHEFSIFGELYLIGFGKYVSVFAEAIEEKFEIKEGIVIDSPKYSGGHPKKTRVLYGDHPIPGKNSLEASTRLLEFVRSLPKNSTVLCLVMGGASALFEIPPPQIELEDLNKTIRILLQSGLNIYEINTIRKNLSRVKGGKLLQFLAPRKTITLIISDVPGDDPSYVGSGPTIPDKTTPKDALRILKTKNILDKIPKNIKNYLEKTQGNNKYTHNKTMAFIVANNALALRKIREHLTQKHRAIILTDKITGEARDTGQNIAYIAQDYDKLNNSEPTIILVGGETHVTVKGKGIGGRNQELALGAAIALNKTKDTIVLASVGTDGIDNVNVAGAIVDNQTYHRASKLGLTPEDYLKNNDSYNFFRKLKDHIITGKTGTNTADIIIAIKINKTS